MVSSFKFSKNKALHIFYLAEKTHTDKETVIEVLRDHGLYVKKDKCNICGATFKRYLVPMCQECIDRVNDLKEKREARREKIEWELCQLEIKRWNLLRSLADFDRTIYEKKEALKLLKNDPTHIE